MYATMKELKSSYQKGIRIAESGFAENIMIFRNIMLMYGKVSQENYVELTAASAIPNKEIKSPQILRY